MDHTMYFEVLAKIYKDSVSHHELLTQYQHINDIYNGHMNLLLTIFGIGMGIIAIIVPIFGYSWFKKKFEDQELERKKLEKEMRTNFDLIIEDTKRELKDEFENTTKEKIERLVEKINETSKKNLSSLEEGIWCNLYLSEGILFAIKEQYKDSLEIYFRAVETAVKANNYKIIQNVIYNIQSDEKYKNIDIKTVSPLKGYNVEQHLVKIENQIKDNEAVRLVFEEFKKMINNILLH